MSEHVAWMEDTRNAHAVLISLKGRNHLEGLGIDGRIILECM
jgi:hypothetical protein